MGAMMSPVLSEKDYNFPVIIEAEHRVTGFRTFAAQSAVVGPKEERVFGLAKNPKGKGVLRCNSPRELREMLEVLSFSHSEAWAFQPISLHCFEG